MQKLQIKLMYKEALGRLHENIVLHLRGLGHTGEPERISFGHVFPPVNDKLVHLKKQDKVSPLDFYVAKWVFPNVPVKGMPNSKIDIVFYLEGDQAKRNYNSMIHKPYASWNEGEYNVEHRYGLWLSKDFIPVSRKNDAYFGYGRAQHRGVCSQGVP